MKVLSASLVFIFCVAAHAEVTQKSLARYMEQVGAKGFASINTLEGFPLSTENEISLLVPYFQSASSAIREETIGLLRSSCTNSKDEEFRCAVTQKLVEVLENGSNDIFVPIVLTLEGSFWKNDFSLETRIRLSRELLRRFEAPDFSTRRPLQLVRLIAKAELRDALPIVETIESIVKEKDEKELKTQNSLSTLSPLAFTCKAVRARFGDDLAMEELGESFASLQTEIDKLNACYALEVVSRSEAIELIRPMLFTDTTVLQAMNVISNDIQDELIAQRVSKSLSRMLTDFPDPNDLTACREWLNRHPPGYDWNFR